MRNEILLLNSCADSAEMYSVGLGLAGYRTRIANDAQEARVQWRQEAPAAVVADLDQVEADGWSLLRELGARPGWQSVPIVLLSGWLTLPQELRDLPRARILLKPCLPEKLASVLRRVAAGSDQSSGVYSGDVLCCTDVVDAGVFGGDMVPLPGGRRAHAASIIAPPGIGATHCPECGATAPTVAALSEHFVSLHCVHCGEVWLVRERRPLLAGRQVTHHSPVDS